MRRLYVVGPTSIASLAAQFGVARKTVRNVIHGKAWRESAPVMSPTAQKLLDVEEERTLIHGGVDQAIFNARLAIAKIVGGLAELEACFRSNAVMALAKPIRDPATASTPAPAAEVRPSAGCGPLGSEQNQVGSETRPGNWHTRATLFEEIPYRLRAELDERIHAMDNFMDGWRRLSPQQLTESLKLFVADVRLAQEQIHPNHPLQRMLAAILRRMTAIFRESGVHLVVPGLARADKGDWAQLREVARRHIRPPRIKVSKAAGDGAEQEIEDEPEPVRIALPRVAALVGARAVVLATNMRVRAREAALTRATDLAFTSFEIQSENPRATAALEMRIRNGSFPVVLIAHEFLGHVVTDKLSEACRTSKTAWGWCGRAGIGAVLQALQRIESAL